MPSDFPSDQEFILRSVLKKHEQGRPAAANPKHGDHVEDVSGWKGKYTADPSAGTGEGAACEPQKMELI